MHLAILVTNTDRSAFAARHPRDGEKFTSLIRAVRPGWRCTAFESTEGDLPDPAAGFDGAIITGSPASVRGDASWIAALTGWIRSAVDRGVPLFGACFGHQAIAQALGGEVGDNPGPFVLGRVAVEITAPTGFMAGAPATIGLYAAHAEQVLRLPPGAVSYGRTTGCACAGFTLGARVLTTEYHPEMTPGFIAALIDELDGKLPGEVIARARSSLDRPADNTLFAEWIARFFAQAVA